VTRKHFSKFIFYSRICWVPAFACHVGI